MSTIWRRGRQVPLNVYEGDRPVCQCHTPEDAAQIVACVNDSLRYRDAAGATNRDYKKQLDEIARILYPMSNEGFAYVPDQLVGMVRSIKEGNNNAYNQNYLTGLVAQIRTLRQGQEANNQHIEQLEKERDQLIAAIESLPLPNKPKHS